MAFLGLRVGECVRVRFSDINLERRTIRVLNIKEKEWEYMDLPPRAHEAIFSYISRYEDKIKERGGWLIHNNVKTAKGEKMHHSEGNIRRVFRDIIKELKLDDTYLVLGTRGFQPGEARNLYRLSCHSFRHFFGAKCYELTQDLVLTAKLLRHKNIQTTMTYLEAISKKKKAAICSIFPSQKQAEVTKGDNMQEFMEVFRMYQQMKTGKMGAL